jgi:hypothetical protein
VHLVRHGIPIHDLAARGMSDDHDGPDVRS